MAPPTPDDPRRDPSWQPPKRPKVMGVEVPPNPTIRERSGHPTLSMLWDAAKKWSPLGIVAALIIGYYALGGEAGIVRIARAWSAEDALVAEMKAVRAELAIEREARLKSMAQQHADHENLSSLCDFVSATNGGRPNPTWCSADSRAIRVDAKQSPPPMYVTDRAWIHVE